MSEPALKLHQTSPQEREEVKKDWSTQMLEAAPESVEPAEEGESWLISYADMMTLLVGFFVVLQSFSKIDSSSFEKVKLETTKLFGGQYQIPFEDLTKELKKVVEEQKVADQVIFQQTDRGVQITFKGALFFDSGSVELRAEALKLMTSLIPVISAKAKNFGIVVEGHTDSTPVVPKGFVVTNWELSSVRACRVLRMFQEKGFDPNHMKALGWGETRPILPNKDADGNLLVQNQAQNRRVVIKILKDLGEI